MSPTIPAAVVVALLSAVPFQQAAADDADKTVIESSPGKYKEVYQGKDGTKMEYEEQDGKTTKQFEDKRGVVIKEEANRDGVKKVYQDGDCKQETVVDAKNGETKVTTSGNCAD